MMSKLNIQLFGSPRIVYKGDAVEIDTRKAVAMLAYLAVTAQRHSRDSLAALLWPEYDHRRGRAALRRTLSALKTSIDGFGLAIERDSLGLDLSADITIDVLEFTAAIDSIQAHNHGRAEYCPRCLTPLSQAVDLCSGEFMAGFSLRDSVNFDDWQYLQSESLRRKLSIALQGVIYCFRSEGRYQDAIAYGLKLLAQDPLHEPAHRQLMTLYALDGQRAAALKQYRDCVAVLDKELGVAPLPETSALYEQILSGELSGSRPVGSRVLSEGGARQVAPVVEGQIIAADISQARPPLEESSSYALPLVGRDRELDAIQRWYDSAGDSGRLFVIEGEPGIGKTRLAQSFINQVRKRGALIAAAQCYQGEIDLAYTPFAEALDSAIRTWERAHSLDTLPEHCLLEASRLIPDLAPKPGAAFMASPLDTPGAQRRFFEGVLQILATVIRSQPPGVLFIDDLHWADDSSIDLLGYMVRRLARWPFFVLVTWRQEEFPARQRLRQLLADAQRDGLADHLFLERLDEQAVAALMKSVRGSMPLDPISTARLLEESEGLPFFLVEYLNVLKESEKDPMAIGVGSAGPAVLGSDQSISRVAADSRAESLPMPEGVRNLLRSRLNTVSQTAQQLTQAAAVIGRSFDYEILLETSGRSDEEAVSALEELLGHGLVIEQHAADGPPSRINGSDSIGQPKLDFSHEKLRTLVYEDMSLGRRRLLHRRVAQALVNQRRPLAAGESSRPALVAFHFQLGGLEEEAASYFKEAGDNARDLYANAEALAHYRSALALGHEDAAGLHEAIGDLLTLKGDYDQALANYEAAAAQLEPVRQSDEIAILEMKLGGVYHRRGDWALAASHYGQSYDQAADACQQARLLTDWSLTTFHGGDIDSAQELAERAYDRAQSIDDKQALALAHNVLGILANSKGDHRTAILQLEESLALASDLDDHIVKIAALNSLSLALRSAQEQEQALTLVEDALALCVEVGDRHRQAALHNNMADLLHDLGRSDEAMVHLKQSAAIFARIGGEVDHWRPEIWMLTEW